MSEVDEDKLKTLMLGRDGDHYYRTDDPDYANEPAATTPVHGERFRSR